MDYRSLGRTGVKVSPLCLGTMNFGGRTDEKDALDIIQRAMEQGINFIDTANVYNDGESEKVVGKALKKSGERDQIVLATKVHGSMGKGPNDRGNHRRHIVAQCDASLKRLDTDRIDLYQIHRPMSEIPIDETLRALDDLIRAGKVLYVGVSMWTGGQMMEAHAVAERWGLDRIVSNQPVYNMLRRDIESDVIPTCEDLGVGQVVYSPLAQGVLTGKYAGGEVPPGSRASQPDKQGRFMSEYLSEDNLRRVAYLSPVAEQLGMSMAQLALAWCLRQSNVSSVICGASRVGQIEDNAGASGRTIPADALNRIEDVLN